MNAACKHCRCDGGGGGAVRDKGEFVVCYLAAAVKVSFLLLQWSWIIFKHVEPQSLFRQRHVNYDGLNCNRALVWRQKQMAEMAHSPRAGCLKLRRWISPSADAWILDIGVVTFLSDRELWPYNTCCSLIALSHQRIFPKRFLSLMNNITVHSKGCG